jgi:hypothetical protein
MCEIEPIRSVTDIGVIQPSLGPIWRELEWQSKRSALLRGPGQSAGVTV